MRFVYFFLAIALFTFGTLTGVIGLNHANVSMLVTASFACGASAFFAVAWAVSEILRIRRIRRSQRSHGSELIGSDIII